MYLFQQETAASSNTATATDTSTNKHQYLQQTVIGTLQNVTSFLNEQDNQKHK